MPLQNINWKNISKQIGINITEELKETVDLVLALLRGKR